VKWAYTVTILMLGGCSKVEHASVARRPDAVGGVTIRDVRIFDGEKTIESQDVRIEAGRITSIAPASTSTPAGAVIHGKGRTLLPGLIDAHAHLYAMGTPPWVSSGLPDPAAAAGMLLHGGVTSALIAQGGSSEADLLEAAQKGRALAPHLFLAGPGLTAPEGHPIPLIHALAPWPVSALLARRQPVAADAAQSRAAVDRVADETQGTLPFFKIFFDSLPEGSPHLTKEALKAAIEEAKARGMRPVVHTLTPEDMVTAAELHPALLMHCAMKGDMSEEQAARVTASGVPFVTTVRVFSAAFELTEGEASAIEREVLDANALAAFHHRPKDFTLKGFEVDLPRFPELGKHAKSNMRKLFAAGASFFIGTDSGAPGVIPGASIHREMALLVELGVPASIVLAAGTSRPALFLDPRGTFGRVAVGQRADLLLVRGDPTQNIGDLDAIDEVFLDGDRLERRGLPRR
jgi:imidazolonepropionase-like amidohydrolase